MRLIATTLILSLAGLALANPILPGTPLATSLAALPEDRVLARDTDNICTDMDGFDAMDCNAAYVLPRDTQDPCLQAVGEDRQDCYKDLGAQTSSAAPANTPTNTPMSVPMTTPTPTPTPPPPPTTTPAPPTPSDLTSFALQNGSFASSTTTYVFASCATAPATMVPPAAINGLQTCEIDVNPPIPPSTKWKDFRLPNNFVTSACDRANETGNVWGCTITYKPDIGTMKRGLGEPSSDLSGVNEKITPDRTTLAAVEQLDEKQKADENPCTSKNGTAYTDCVDSYGQGSSLNRRMVYDTFHYGGSTISPGDCRLENNIRTCDYTFEPPLVFTEPILLADRLYQLQDCTPKPDNRQQRCVVVRAPGKRKRSLGSKIGEVFNDAAPAPSATPSPSPSIQHADFIYNNSNVSIHDCSIVFNSDDHQHPIHNCTVDFNPGLNLSMADVIPHQSSLDQEAYDMKSCSLVMEGDGGTYHCSLIYDKKLLVAPNTKKRWVAAGLGFEGIAAKNRKNDEAKEGDEVDVEDSVPDSRYQDARYLVKRENSQEGKAEIEEDEGMDTKFRKVSSGP